jgi:hypothetical protein
MDGAGGYGDVEGSRYLRIILAVLNDVVLTLIKMEEECAVFLVKIIVYLEGDLGALMEEFIDLLQNMACLFSPSTYVKITRIILFDFNEKDYKEFEGRGCVGFMLDRFPVFVDWLCGIIQKLDSTH